jgi:hypothetical protein
MECRFKNDIFENSLGEDVEINGISMPKVIKFSVLKVSLYLAKTALIFPVLRKRHQ